MSFLTLESVSQERCLWRSSTQKLTNRLQWNLITTIHLVFWLPFTTKEIDRIFKTKVTTYMLIKDLYLSSSDTSTSTNSAYCQYEDNNDRIVTVVQFIMFSIGTNYHIYMYFLVYSKSQIKPSLKMNLGHKYMSNYRVSKKT